MVDNDDELLNEKQSLVVAISFLTEVDLCGKKREREKIYSVSNNKYMYMCRP